MPKPSKITIDQLPSDLLIAHGALELAAGIHAVAQDERVVIEIDGSLDLQIPAAVARRGARKPKAKKTGRAR